MVGRTIGRWLGRFATRAVLIAGAAVSTAQTASADNTNEHQYLLWLANNGISSTATTRPSQLKLGYLICKEKSSGYSHQQMLDSLTNGPNGLSNGDAVTYVAAAVYELCP